jgi:hypothetical protein
MAEYIKTLMTYIKYKMTHLFTDVEQRERMIKIGTLQPLKCGPLAQSLPMIGIDDSIPLLFLRLIHLIFPSVTRADPNGININLTQLFKWIDQTNPIYEQFINFFVRNNAIIFETKYYLSDSSIELRVEWYHIFNRIMQSNPKIAWDDYWIESLGKTQRCITTTFENIIQVFITLFPKSSKLDIHIPHAVPIQTNSGNSSELNEHNELTHTKFHSYPQSDLANGNPSKLSTPQTPDPTFCKSPSDVLNFIIDQLTPTNIDIRVDCFVYLSSSVRYPFVHHTINWNILGIPIFKLTMFKYFIKEIPSYSIDFDYCDPTDQVLK